MLLPAMGFLGGLTIGSFANACIYRMPLGISVVGGRSKCPTCSSTINFYDNIPVLSWLALGGKCRHCHERISPSYLLVELVFGVSFASAFWTIGLSYALWGVCIALFASLVGGLIDTQIRKIPNSITYPSAMAIVIIALMESLLRHSWTPLLGALVSMFAVFSSFVAINVASKGGMGLGDAKLAAVIAGALIPFGYRYVLWAMVAAFFGGSIYGIVQIKLHRASRKTAVPFGLFLALGLLISPIFHIL